MKVKNQYLKILEYFLRSIKKKICKTEKFIFKISPIPDGVQVRHVVWPIKHRNIMVSKPLGSAFGSVGSSVGSRSKVAI